MKQENKTTGNGDSVKIEQINRIKLYLAYLDGDEDKRDEAVQTALGMLWVGA